MLNIMDVCLKINDDDESMIFRVLYFLFWLNENKISRKILFLLGYISSRYEQSLKLGYYTWYLQTYRYINNLSGINSCIQRVSFLSAIYPGI